MRGSLLLHVTLLQVAFVTQGEGSSRGAVRRVEVRTEVEHRYAFTVLVASLANLRDRPHLLTLTMLLPRNALVSSLTIETGGRNYTTEVIERQRRGRRPHEHDDQGRTPRRSRSQDTQRFKASATVAPLDTATFYLSYEELLQRIHGRYTYALHLLPHSEEAHQEVRLTVREKEPINDFRILQVPGPRYAGDVQQELVSSREVRVTYQRGSSNSSSSNSNSSNEDRNEELVLSIGYDVDRKVDGGEIQVLGNFFVHYFCPEGLPKLPTHTVFVLDVSGSMHDFGKLEQLKLAMESILKGMPPEDSFEVLVFSTRVTSLGVYRARPREVERGVAKIQRLQALGGTNINDALLQALLGANAHNATHANARQVVFLTDGKPNLGETKSERLRRNVREANIHQLPIFSLALGQDADERLLRQVSADNRGFTRKIDDQLGPAQQLQDFFKEIASPLMTNVDVLYLEDEVDPNSVVRQGPSTYYYSGNEMVLTGRLAEGATEVNPIVAGQGKEGPLQFRVSRVSSSKHISERNNSVERLWAYLSVLDLLETQELVDDRNLREEMRVRAKEIAIRFNFVTRLTSLEVVDPENANGGTHPGLKSASRHQKSNTGALGPKMDQDLALISAPEFAKTLPGSLGSRIHDSGYNRGFSFSDNDPHFVVQVPGLELPFCFDIHGSPNDVFSLVRDKQSGILVNGEVTAAVRRPGATYFTKIFISLGAVNFTITPKRILVDCLDDAGDPTVESVSTSLWPFKKMGHRVRKSRRSKRPRRRRKSSRKPRSINRLSQHRQEVPNSVYFPHAARPWRLERPPSSSSWSKTTRRRRVRSRVQAPMRYPRQARHEQVHPQSLRRLQVSSNRHNVWPPGGTRRSQTNAFREQPRRSRNQRHPQSTLSFMHPQAMTNYVQSLYLRSALRPQDTRNYTRHGIKNNVLSRSARGSSHPHSHRPSNFRYHNTFHPQSREFIHPQSRVNLRSRHITNRNSGENRESRPSRKFSKDSIHLRRPSRGRKNSPENEESVIRECSKTFTWKKAAGRRYGDVVVALRNHRKLDLLLGDVDANLLVTRTKNRHGQHFLGFYLENHRILSPNTTGIIGQFAYKTVGTIASGRTTPQGTQNREIRLAVVQPGPTRRYQVSEVNAFLSSRRSLLHKTHVDCFFIRHQGRGLVAGSPDDYLLPCLAC